MKATPKQELRELAVLILSARPSKVYNPYYNDMDIRRYEIQPIVFKRIKEILDKYNIK